MKSLRELMEENLEEGKNAEIDFSKLNDDKNIEKLKIGDKLVNVPDNRFKDAKAARSTLIQLTSDNQFVIEQVKNKKTIIYLDMKDMKVLVDMYNNKK